MVYPFSHCGPCLNNPNVLGFEYCRVTSLGYGNQIRVLTNKQTNKKCLPCHTMVNHFGFVVHAKLKFTCITPSVLD